MMRRLMSALLGLTLLLCLHGVSSQPVPQPQLGGSFNLPIQLPTVALASNDLNQNQIPSPLSSIGMAGNMGQVSGTNDSTE